MSQAVGLHQQQACNNSCTAADCAAVLCSRPPVRDQLHLQEVPNIKGMLNKQEQHGLKDLPATTATRADYEIGGHGVLGSACTAQSKRHAHNTALGPMQILTTNTMLHLSDASHLTLLPKTKVSASTVAEKVEKPFTLQHAAVQQNDRSHVKLQPRHARHSQVDTAKVPHHGHACGNLFWAPAAETVESAAYMSMPHTRR